MANEPADAAAASPDWLDRTWDTDPGLSDLSAERPQVELVHGPAPRLASETRALLLVRLRAATLVLLGAFILFALRGFVLSFWDDDVMGESRTVLVSRIVCGIILALCAVALWTRSNLTLKQLRGFELIVFGSTCVSLGLVHERLLQQAANAPGPAVVQTAVSSSLVMWFAIVVIYGTFIPNLWKRAALVAGTIALVPFAALTWAYFREPALTEYIEADHYATIAAVMLIGLATSVYGSHTIGALRREAFEARRLGQYRLTRRLGRGGMGEVFLAEHQMLKRPCAIKTIRAGREWDGTALARFEREVHAMAALSHWNTVEVFDYGRAEDGTFFYVMEYLPGLSLQEVVARQGPMQPARAVHLMRQVCDALVEAHASGLVHRDIKPSNVMASHRGGTYDVAKLLDFGLVEHAVVPDDARTAEGAVAGSPHFMAPELTQGALPTPQSDIYSVGAVIYFLLVGQPPFSGSDPVEVMRAHVEQDVIPPAGRQPGTPADLEEIVMRCLAKHPHDRYASVAALDEALAHCRSANQWTQELAAHWWVARETAGEDTTIHESTITSA